MLYAFKTIIRIFCSSGTENLNELLSAVMQRTASSNDHRRPQLLVSCWAYLFILYFLWFFQILLFVFIHTLILFFISLIFFLLFLYSIKMMKVTRFYSPMILILLLRLTVLDP